MRIVAMFPSENDVIALSKTADQQAMSMLTAMLYGLRLGFDASENLKAKQDFVMEAVFLAKVIEIFEPDQPQPFNPYKFADLNEWTDAFTDREIYVVAQILVVFVSYLHSFVRSIPGDPDQNARNFCLIFEAIERRIGRIKSKFNFVPRSINLN